MTVFNNKDVTTVAQALIDTAVEWDNGRENAMNPHDGYMCIHCSASEYRKAEELKHDLDCPALIAQDLLTGEDNA